MTDFEKELKILTDKHIKEMKNLDSRYVSSECLDGEHGVKQKELLLQYTNDIERLKKRYSTQKVS